MQPFTPSIKQTIAQVMSILNNVEWICDSRSKQILLALTNGIQSCKTVHTDQIDLILRTFIEILNKSLNINTKIIPEIWIFFIRFILKVQNIQENQPKENHNPLQSLTNLQDFYNFINEKQNQDKMNVFHQSEENLILILTVWQKIFSLSDLKSIQYALISLSLIIDQSQFTKQNKNSSLQTKFICINKISLYIVKHHTKIKDFQTFQNFIKLLQKIQDSIYKNYQKQINEGKKRLRELFKLYEVISYQNIHLKTWQNLMLARFLCLAGKKSLQNIEISTKILCTLNKTFFLERAINYCKIKDKITNFPTIVPLSQIQFMIFCSLVELWVNYKIIYDAQISKEQNLENKSQLRQRQENTKGFIKEMLKILTKRQITIQMMRQVVKNLRIINNPTAITQWKQVFSFMHELLKSYPENKTIIQFTDEKSYISKGFSPSIKYPFTILLSVKGESIPFKEEKILIQFIDLNSKQKIIITMRNYQKSCMIFSFVKVIKNNIWGKWQKEFKWLQYESNRIEIVLKSNKIKMFVNNQENVCLSMQNSLGKVDEMVLGDRQTGMGSTLNQLLQFKVIQYSIFEAQQKTEFDIVNFICPKYSVTHRDSIKENLKFHKCKQVKQQSFITLMQRLGDMQLFMVILFHALRKLKNNEDDLLQLLRFVLKLMQEFTVYKKVELKELTAEEKDDRRRAIQCLGWFFAKQSKSVFVIFELMRFLYIRGTRNNNEILKFLCNFSYWKQFKLDKQLVIVMKIKQLLKQATKQEEKLSNLGFCRFLLFDMILYFKQTGFKIADKENCLRFHQKLFQTVYEQIKDIIQVNSTGNKKVKLYMLEIFRFIEYIISLISCMVNRKIHEDNLDLTLAVELTMFLRDLAKLIFVSKERKIITKQQIDVALEAFFKKQQQQLMLPLSLNAQQACDQRFTMFLGNILSQSKSLISLFDTEMTFFQETQIKFYPIYADVPSICTENKIHTNIIHFEIYLSMLSQKSWNYILFAMPYQQYTQKYCQSLWRISFYELFKEKKYFHRLSKMLQLTPFPKNQYCLIKIFEAVLFCPHFQKQHLLRIIKSENFTKGICPFKISQLLVKYLKKIQIGEQEKKKAQNNDNQKQVSTFLDEQKIYYVLFHAENINFDSCQGIINNLKKRKSFQVYKHILYSIVLKELISNIKQKKEQRKKQKTNSFNFQSDFIDTVQRKRTRLFSNDSIDVSSNSNFDGTTNFTVDDEITIEEKETKNEDQINTLLKEQEKKQEENSITVKLPLAIQAVNALEYYLNQFTTQNMKSFFGLDSHEDLQPLRENFLINVQGMIKSLQINESKKGNIQFQKYLSFLEVYLKNFSQHLILQKFQDFNVKSSTNSIEKNQEIKKGRNKILVKTIFIDLKKNSTEFFLQEINKRRLQLHTLEHIWSLISHRNPNLWNTFISSQRYYSLSDITTDLGERFMLKISTDKPKIDLPKMMTKYSVSCSISLISDKNINNEQSQPSTLFDDCDQLLMNEFDQVEAKTKQRVRKASTHIVKEIKTKKIRVLLITNNKIYQGLLFMPQRKILRFQQTYPSCKLYEKICANEQQRRTDDDIQKEPMFFDIVLGKTSKIFYRKYLFFETAIEIFSNERSYFFSFENEQKRSRFCTTYLKDFKVITYQLNKKQILQQSQNWKKGLISNYDYLMKLNQYGNRSVNDLSQYYVMPWTISQFQQTNINLNYFNNEQYFRDLTKPLGKLFEKKWKEIQSRFKMSYGRYLKEQTPTPGAIEPFLYGSFYSNPAIVTNYLIRIEPFSTLHYHLQSQKIDLADRLFYRFSDQYISLSRNIGDLKQLIPEFYNNSQFLKNKSRLNLGARQNKEVVNDVRLPKWAQTAQEFIFKMRHFLESPIVSKNLHAWIDLIFGQKAKKQNAIKSDNLFMSQIYGPKEVPKNQQKLRQSQNINHQDSQLQIESRILFNKEFGQLPTTLFDEDHPIFDYNQDYFTFKGSVEHIFTLGPCSIKDSDLKIGIKENFLMVTSTHSLQLIQTGSKDYTQKSNPKLISELCLNNQTGNSEMISGSKFGASLPYIFYVNKKQNTIYSRYIKKSKFFGSLQLKEEFLVSEGTVFKWINDCILVVALGNIIKVYSFDQSSLYNTGMKKKITQMKIQQSKPGFLMREFPIFSQHKADIIFIEKNEVMKLVLTIDSMNKVFLLKYEPNGMKVVNYFQLRGLRFQEQITKIMLHKLSMIVCYTSQHRLIAYTFYGDILGAKQVVFNKSLKRKNQQIGNCVYLFDENSSAEILIGTNYGNLWKIQLFELFKSLGPISEKEVWFEKISLNQKKQQLEIKDIEIKRYGRHWEIYAISINKEGKKIITKIQSSTLKNLILDNKK